MGTERGEFDRGMVTDGKPDMLLKLKATLAALEADLEDLDESVK